MTAAPGALEWGIRSSLIEYVSSIDDGAVTAGDGARWSGGRAVYPLRSVSSGSGGPPRWEFGGTVVLSGHDGMLSLAFAEPVVEVGAERVRVLVRRGDRSVAIAESVEPPVREASGLTVTDLRLTADGATLFEFQYALGAQLDDLQITAEEHLLQPLPRRR